MSDAREVDRRLVLTYRIKIGATLGAWCAPLLLLDGAVLRTLGLTPEPSLMPLRMLGWAYLALCVGYAAGLRAALAGRVENGPLDVGIVSNGGAALLLAWYGVTGSWTNWHMFVQFHLWGSALVAALIAASLLAARLRHRATATVAA